MSALTPHIRVLRALAVAYHAFSADVLTAAMNLQNGQIRDGMTSNSAMLKSLGFVHDKAADSLEASEPSLPEDEHPITYDPKGKR